MQNNNVHILSTKLLPQELLSQAAQHGVKISCLPFIQTNSITDDDLVQAIRLLSKESITVIFTSSKAVTAVAALLVEPPQWTIYCLFGATKEQVELHFPQSIIHTTAKDSSSLANQLLAGGVREAYFFCGNKRMDTIPQQLDGKLNLKQRIVYTTEATPHKVTDNFDGILFFSPSAVDSFFTVNKVDQKVVCFALGNTTAASLKPHTQNIIIASSASGRAMLHEVIEHFGKSENTFS